MITSIWNLLGIFYLSLIPIGYFLYKHKPHINLISLLVLSNALVISLFFSIKAINEDKYPIKNIFENPTTHIIKTTQGQSEFALQVIKVIPENATGCIYWSGDMNTRYLVQKIYPRKFTPIKRGEDISSCKYLISLGQPDPQLVPFPLFQDKQNYIYKLQ